MPQVIIHKSEKGNVAVVVPAKGWTIEQVIAKDVIGRGYTGHHVVDHASLPWHHLVFFDAWRLHDEGTVHIDFEHAKKIAHDKVNRMSKEAHTRRQQNVAVGLDTTQTDEAFTAGVKAVRSSVEAATTLEHLRAALESVPKEP